MEALLLIVIPLMLSAQQIAQKEYDKRTQNGAYSYTLIAALVAISLFFITSGGTLNFRLDVSLYSVLYAVGYATTMITGFLAIKTGSLSLTVLIIQYSLIVPAVYGMIMLGDPLKPTVFAGLALLIVSLIFVNFNKNEKAVRPTLKWAIFVGLSFLGNGVCNTVQKVQQVDFDGQYKSEFMIVAFGISIAFLICLTLAFERRDFLRNLRRGGIICAGSGVCNGICNFSILVLAGMLPSSVMYPIISAGGTIAASLAALFIYREKMSRQQLVGLGLGILAIVALNL